MEDPVETKDEERIPPHYLQVDLWKRIVGENAHYAELVRTGLFRYYCDIRSQYEKAGPEWVANMTVLTGKEAIDDMLYINYITIRWPLDSLMSVSGTENTEWTLLLRGIMSWMLAVQTAYILAENDPEPDLLSSRHERIQGGIREFSLLPRQACVHEMDDFLISTAVEYVFSPIRTKTYDRAAIEYRVPERL
ncbi:hypothetical protein [Gimesia algae]|nr:hypothetical protein [Gimesia algae]